jgi:hypothetical protein
MGRSPGERKQQNSWDRKKSEEGMSDKTGRIRWLNASQFEGIPSLVDIDRCDAPVWENNQYKASACDQPATRWYISTNIELDIEDEIFGRCENHSLSSGGLQREVSFEDMVVWAVHES